MRPEQAQNPNRDMRRAEWQRGLGMIVVGRLSDDLHAQYFADAPDEVLASIMEIVDAGTLDIGPLQEEFCPVLTTAVRFGKMVITQTYPAIKLPDTILQGKAESIGAAANLRLFTWNRTACDVGREALQTTTALSINLLGGVLATALKEDLLTRLPQTFTDVADYLRTDWFQALCQDATLAANGFWAEFSTEGLNFDDASVAAIDGQGNDILFDVDVQDGQLRASFAREYTRLMHASLVQANQAAIAVDNEPYSEQVNPIGSLSSSSGCPARHLQPTLVQVEGSQLSRVAELLNTTPEALMEPRESTALAVGLNHFADLLERADAYYLNRRWQPAASVNFSSIASIIN